LITFTQVTSDGKPKIVDIVDCCGSGDVDCSTVVKATEENGILSITGLTGRKLILNKKWKNPSGDYKIGVKRAFDFYPKGLVKRLTEESKKKFMEKHLKYVNEAQEQLNAFDKRIGGKATATKAECQEKADLQSRIEYLKALEKNFDEPGPIYDCVIFHDGEHWQSVIDRRESGDLTNEIVMTDYNISRQFSYFGDSDLLNYSVHIYDNGQTLSIVTNAGSHGTLTIIF
jgi:tripeptidyl-peptidase-2